MVLAINYRKKGETNDTAPGMWKEFTSKQAAEDWFKVRTRKTKTSPKGTIIFENKAQLDTVLEFGFDTQPVSLQLAIKNYLKWKKL